MAEPFRCGLVLLAAGASTRMGRPKQLLPVGGRPLLRVVAEAALAAPVAPVIVVLGAHAAEIAPCLDGLAVRVLAHDGWAEGMGSSLRAGMAALLAGGETFDGVVVALADQPELSAAHLARLVATHRETGRSIVASRRAGVWQPPAFFAAGHFAELQASAGDAGARRLLQAHRADLIAVDWAGQDLDTPGDYENFQAGGGS